MTTPLDLAFVALIAVVWTLYEWRISWPGFVRRAALDPDRARVREYLTIIVTLWTLSVACILLFRHEARPLAALALAPVAGWRWIAAIVPNLAVALMTARNAAVLRRSARARASIRTQIERSGELALLLPRTTGQIALFIGASITAGICEELLYRGFLWHALAAWMGPWLAVLPTSLAFGLNHAYQGRAGVLRTGIIGLVMTAMVALTGSLIPAMVLHALIDIQGTAAWLGLRHEPSAPAMATAS
jgi:membrane protease YdiL (CAAX protease family)